MTCIRTTRTPERVWQTRPQWQTPWHREWVHGRIQGLPNRRDPSARIFIALAILIASYFGGQELFHQGEPSAQQAAVSIHGD